MTDIISFFATLKIKITIVCLAMGALALQMSGSPDINAEPGTPEAAVMIRNGSKEPGIKELVEKGYIISTRADSDTKQARVNDRSFIETACNSGAQIITTDYYQKSTYFDSPYMVYF